MQQGTTATDFLENQEYTLLEGYKHKETPQALTN